MKMLQGCDGSVLLDGSASGPSEKDAPPNLTLRAQAFKIIEKLRSRVEKQCGRIVSCADITAVAARDAVFLVSNSFINKCLFMTKKKIWC
jgi:peroxidase